MDDWKTPDFVEIKMDAEIGSYQADYEPLGDDNAEPTRADEAR
jgi:hypothetical protein